MKLRNKKTGEIGFIEHDLLTTDPLTGETLLTVRYKDYSGINCYKDYATIKFFNEQWEDYTPADPLIKDPKIRKAVRAWAEANNYPKTMELYYNAPNFVLRSDISTIEFDQEIEPLRHGDQHTIAELCGEEIQ